MIESIETEGPLPTCMEDTEIGGKFSHNGYLWLKLSDTECALCWGENGPEYASPQTAH